MWSEKFDSIFQRKIVSGSTTRCAEKPKRKATRAGLGTNAPFTSSNPGGAAKRVMCDDPSRAHCTTVKRRIGRISSPQPPIRRFEFVRAPRTRESDAPAVFTTSAAATFSYLNRLHR